MLHLADVFRQLLRDVRSQKLRTSLTIFGIIWGTVAISLMLAFGTGLHKQLIVQTAGLGDRIVIGWPGLTSIPFEGLGKGRKIRIAEEDIEYVQNQATGVKAISSEYGKSMTIVYGTKKLPVDVSGVTPIFGAMRNLVPQEGGRFINPTDWERQRRVIFLGNEVVKDIFGESPAVGKTILVQNSPFLVIGVLVKKSQDSSYGSRDSGKAFIPGTTYLALTGEKYVDNFVFQSKNDSQTKQTTAEVRALLGKKLRFDPTDKEALSIWDTTEQFHFFDVFMLSFNLFLGIVGSLTLIVGGIGVSNIMNVVVEERTREIGIKMALGARQGTILAQFLLETILVTAIGGAIGFAISYGVCSVFPKFGFTEYVGDPKVSPLVAVITATALGLVGIVAGYFPAKEASELDPVVAMKL